jgi:hypothetical protein
MAFAGASKFIAAVVTVAAIGPVIYPGARAVAQPVRHAAVEPTGPARRAINQQFQQFGLSERHLRTHRDHWAFSRTVRSCLMKCHLAKR